MEKLPKYICEWYWKGECIISPLQCNGYHVKYCDKYAPRGPICRFCALRAECEIAEESDAFMINVEVTGDCDKYLDPYTNQPDDIDSESWESYDEGE